MPQSIDYAPIAEFYDSLVRFEADIPFFLTWARRARGAVIELMCGTGRVTIPLLAAGVPVTSVDRSPEMLAVLDRKTRARGLKGSVIRADVIALPLPRMFALAIVPFNSFSELTPTDSQRAALASIRGCLQPGGNLICTLHNPAARIQDFDGTTHERLRVGDPAGDGELVLLVQARFDPETRLVTGSETLESLDATGVVKSRVTIDLRFALPDRADFEQLVRETDFEIEDLYGNYSYEPFDAKTSPFMIWILRCPGVR